MLFITSMLTSIENKYGKCEDSPLGNGKGSSRVSVSLMLSSAISFNFDATYIWLNDKIGVELQFWVVTLKILLNEKKKSQVSNLQGAWMYLSGRTCA